MSHRLTELRLTEFKTFRNQVLPLDGLTVIAGRNSSGKSNALDGLEVLSRLASGNSIIDAIDSRRAEGGPIRGGLEGCPPHGSNTFTLGCRITTPDSLIDLDITIKEADEPVITNEVLRVYREVDDPAPLGFAMENGRGSSFDGRFGFAGSVDRLVSPQLINFPSSAVADLAMFKAAGILVDTLRSIYHLDPVPHLMRQYVPQRDSKLRRTAENLSAVIGGLAPDSFARLTDALRDLVEYDIDALEIVGSGLNDVMLTVREQGHLTSAREMSDGLLRFLAIATTLLGHGADLDVGQSDPSMIQVVIEELENGLHPSQATKILDLIRSAQNQNVLFTTHSPALLSALTPEEHAGVIVCTRDRAGNSHLTPLPEIEGYPTLMAKGELGRIATMGLLRDQEDDRDFTDFDRLMGL